MTTGVTDFIKIDEVRQEIDSTYPNPGTDVEGKLEVENNGYGHRLIGDAFEFLCELLLYRRCTEVVQPWRETWGDSKHQWTDDENPPITVYKFDGMRWEDYSNISNRSEWEEMNDDLPVWERRRSAIKWAEDEELSKLAEQYVQTGMNTDGVVRAALVNAGWKPSDAIHSWINREAFKDDVLEEMEGLFRLLRDSEWTEGDTVFTNPMFGNHKHILPGEGDLIVDDEVFVSRALGTGVFVGALRKVALEAGGTGLNAPLETYSRVRNQRHPGNGRGGRNRRDSPLGRTGAGRGGVRPRRRRARPPRERRDAPRRPRRGAPRRGKRRG